MTQEAATQTATAARTAATASAGSDGGGEPFRWLLLARLPGCTEHILRHLLAAPARPETLLQAPPARWRAAGAGDELLAELNRWRSLNERHPAHQHALRDWEYLQSRNIALLVRHSPAYPPYLAEIPDPPPMLFVEGDAACLLRPMLAIVGSRRTSQAGLRCARELSRGMVAAGLTVCSGMALGIDGEAHRAALAAGGCTVAVMGSGCDQYYPRRHIGLAREIAASGALVTEFLPGEPPKREYFPQRNRIISGLSLGVAVVEAALRSGSLLTARMALEQNREVFAVPHSIYDPGGAGCHHLIRQGAKLVETADDILEELPGVFGFEVFNSDAASNANSPTAESASTKSDGSGPADADAASNEPDDEAPANAISANAATSAAAAAKPASAGPAASASKSARAASIRAARTAPPHLQTLLDALDYAPAPVDELTRATSRPAAELLAGLVELELLGLVESRDGRYMRR